ncbi:S9 family peptidase [Steroidobacter sp. S1-65]|uniref:S9 family peptidase n=1 Tax=Steroidobacter gossypii TaxID=2805490 RepID=A0ABS1X2X3_9GAMM|nr:S9 family peptidase [Steroidobacter gossypii]MBM0107576.1 S9 family peptidase [Steroidobacter gossypii]
MRLQFAPATCLLAACLALPLVTAVAQEARNQGPQPFTAQDLVRLQRVSSPAISPDGRTVVFSVRETDMAANRGRTDLWSLDLATKGAQPRRLTTHSGNDSSPEWSSDGRELYFLSTRSGSSQVWRLPVNGGEARQVTDLPLDVGSFRVASNGGRLAVTLEVFPDCADLPCTVERLNKTKEANHSAQVYDRIFARHWDTWSDGRISQLFTLTLSNGRAVDPVSVSKALDADIPSKPFGDASEYTFSPDGSKLVFSTRLKGKNEPWSTNFDLYEVAVDGSGLRNLTEHNPAWDTQPVFSRDGSQLAWRAMERPGFESDSFHVVVMDTRTGERRALTKDWDRSVGDMKFAHDGRTLFVTTDHFGQHPLWSIDVKTGKPTMLTGPGRVEAFSVGEKEIVMTNSTLKSPAELQVLTIKGGDLRALPRMNEAALAELKLGDAEQFTFVGAEGATVYGYVMKPATFKQGGKYPVAFIIHGGPQGSFGNSWSYRWNPQTYAGAGYASVFIDFHGSTGYGQAFTDSISQDWGGKPLEDLQKGLEAALQKYPWLDGERMCALGASYGGYMINWIAGNWAEPFKCLVNHAGIFDTRAMAYTTEELWFSEWEQGGAAYEVPENVEKHNPVNHVTKWSKPMLVIHGSLDYRVPYSQGLSTFTALQRRGIPSQLLMFPDENHWVLKPNNSVRWHQQVEQWLNQWTGSGGE